MAENYLQKATQIYRGFDAESTREWLRKNGMTEFAKMLLDDMADARSEEDFKKAEYQFKNRIVVPFFKDYVYPRGEQAVKDFVAENPIINVAPPKSVGSYDDLKKNQAFADSRYAQAYTDEKGNRVVNVPLLQIANDPEELSIAALRLGITPEDLHDHIVNEWRRKKEKEWPELEAAMKKEIIANRHKIADDYANSWYGTVLGAIAPETTAKTLEEIRSGKDLGADAENRAVVTDALVGLGTVLSGSAAGSALKNPKTAAILNKFISEKVLKHPATQAVAGGVVDAGLEAYRQGVSDYYEFDPKTIAEVGTVSATMPSIVGGVISPIAAIPGTGRITRPLMRRLRQMLPNPSEEEIVRNRRIYEQARRATEEASNTRDPIKKERADELLDVARDFIEQSPSAKFGTRYTKDNVKKIIKTTDRAEKFFSPPSKEDYVKAIKERRSKDKELSDKAEEWLNRAKKQWNANYNELSSVPEPLTAWDRIGDNLVEFGSREETLRRRSTGKMKEVPSENLRYLMENDPVTIRTWENGFAPHDKSLMDVYKEWKEKFGGRR